MFKLSFIIFFASFVLFKANGQVNIVTPSCNCVTSNTCYMNLTGGGTTNPNDGTGLIDIRIVNNGQGTVTLPPTGPTLTPPGQQVCPANMQQCCSGMTGCGVRWNIPITQNTNPGTGQARYGSQPWQAVILGTDNSYIGGGVLIDSINVLTVAHKVYNRTATTLKVRMGEWDSNRAVEPYATQEALVIQIRVNPSFIPTNLQNDIAILRLASPIQLGPSPNPAINTACLPQASTVYDNMRCLVSGWGKDAFSGYFQSVIKEVDVPVVGSAECQDKLRRTRLGSGFNLNTQAFICAGGEQGRDSCVGDGGSGLVCNVGSKYQVVGLVAWGIGCGDANVPGVYVRVQNYLTWIQQNQV